MSAAAGGAPHESHESYESHESHEARVALPVAGDEETAACAARLFSASEGRRLLAYLRGITVERRLAPNCDDALLRHLEGQRYLVWLLESLIARGRKGGSTVRR